MAFILGRLDWSKACLSTRNYSVHEAGVSRTLKSDQWNESPRSCDLFSGRWVFDNDSYPLYNESDCPYMSDQLACQKHGRPDSTYQKWRWQPHNCNLKRFVNVSFLRKSFTRKILRSVEYEEKHSFLSTFFFFFGKAMI